MRQAWTQSIYTWKVFVSLCSPHPGWHIYLSHVRIFQESHHGSEDAIPFAHAKDVPYSGICALVNVLMRKNTFLVSSAWTQTSTVVLTTNIFSSKHANTKKMQTVFEIDRDSPKLIKCCEANLSMIVRWRWRCKAKDCHKARVTCTAQQIRRFKDRFGLRL